ncbi:MAG: Lar family restriction alleviation protein [Halopseudomonas sp.]|uniref:Lar family restriction alleviation protein n=1 Tax=Halopseudomonas sp. TaxID=2901191 RepID=UPI0030023FA9
MSGIKAEQLEMLSVTGLLPCPFCGSTELEHVIKKETEEQPEKFLFIQCCNCGATGPHLGSKDQHRALWDVRA